MWFCVYREKYTTDEESPTLTPPVATSRHRETQLRLSLLITNTNQYHIPYSPQAREHAVGADPCQEEGSEGIRSFSGCPFLGAGADRWLVVSDKREIC
jgi:hypothetical protein